MTSGGAATRHWYTCNICHGVHDPEEDKSCHPYDQNRDYSNAPDKLMKNISEVKKCQDL